MENAIMNVNKWNYLLGTLAVTSLIAFFYTKGTYYPFYIVSMVSFILYFSIRKELFLLIILLSLGAIPVMVEYIYGDFGKKMFVVLASIFAIIYLIKKYRAGHNIWY